MMKKEYSAMFDKLAPQKSDNELLQAVLSGKAEIAGKRKKRKRKAIIISAIAAAVLCAATVGVSTAVMMNRPVSADLDRSVPEVKTGNYYLNGDKNSGIWFEVYSDYLTLNGDDVDAFLKATIIKGWEEDGITPNDEGLQIMLEEDKMLFCGKKLYAVKYWGTESTPYVIQVSRHNTETTKEELLNSNAAFPYNGKDTIMLGFMGDFILVD